MSWLVPRAHLTAEQLRAVELSPYEHRLVLGGPGSGKTQVLVHRTDFLRQRYKSRPDKFRLFVYTNTLTSYIQSGLTLLDIPTASVSTLYSWCREYHRRHIGPEPVRHVERTRFGKPGTEPDFDAVHVAVADHVRTVSASPMYDFVMVDEGQDLSARDFALLCGIARHVTVCLDRKQQIYDRGSAEGDILKELGLRKRNLALLDTLRCSPYVITVAAALVDRPGEGEELRNQTRTAVVERETPLVYFARDFDDEFKRLQEVIQIRQRAGDRIAVLLPTRRQVIGFARHLAKDGLVVESQEDLDFTSDAPKLLTYYSAKGLTFDSVLMPRLVPRSSLLAVSRADRAPLVRRCVPCRQVGLLQHRREPALHAPRQGPCPRESPRGDRSGPPSTT